MLTVHQISKNYGVNPILDQVSFSVNAGERWGLVGINGSGKSTLLHILTGSENPDSGHCSLTPSNLRVGYLSQGFVFNPSETIQELLDRYHPSPEHLAQELSKLAESMIIQTENPSLQKRYDQLLGLLEQSENSCETRVRTLKGLGLDHFPMETPIQHLSGGQKTRLMLASVLIGNPQLLLLDEPTNHLDITMLEWLENWLLEFSGGVLIVSHDRTFLDHTVTGILELSEHTHQITSYIGNYSTYLETKLTEREKQWQAYKDQQDEIKRLRAGAQAMRNMTKFHKGGKADKTVTDGFSAGFFANRSKETVQKAKNIEKRIEKLLTEDRIDQPLRTWQMRIDFEKTPVSGQDVLLMENLTIGYPENPLIKNLNLTIQQGQRIALIGANGSGKTSLIKTIIGEIPALNGDLRLGSNVHVGYMTQEQRELNPDWNAIETMRHLVGSNETAMRSFLSKFLFTGDDVFTPIGLMSYGERARLALACLVADGCNFLILDEPVNHLDIPSRTNFEKALSQFDGTVLAVVHDRFFIQGFATQVWEVRDQKIYTREK
ncbi:MAG: ABC transporter ATP-binding protein [Anaerolineaceae bacterium]|nr:ABC transporter ATP-binding protein [Anaerolineaceae bacterium]